LASGRPPRLRSQACPWNPRPRVPPRATPTLLAAACSTTRGASARSPKHWSAGWREHTGVGRSTLYLTEQETAELTEAIDGLLADYVTRRPLDDFASRPEGSVPVEFTLIVTPREPTAEGN
jgi:hypothetical protein